jgi:hypothetical protein
MGTGMGPSPRSSVALFAGAEGTSTANDVAWVLADSIVARMKVETARIFLFLLLIAFLRGCSKNTTINSIIRSDIWIIYYENQWIYYNKIFRIALI